MQNNLSKWTPPELNMQRSNMTNLIVMAQQCSILFLCMYFLHWNFFCNNRQISVF